MGEGSGDNSGYSIANAGDVDGDGLDDILVGAKYNDDGGGDWGKTYLFYGKTLGDRTRINLARSDYSFIGEAWGYAGHSVASAGDVDGDGKSDILIGAVDLYSAGHSYGGATYLVLSSSLLPGEDEDGRVEHTMSLSDADYKFSAVRSNQHIGQTVASAGDIDGDDLADIMIHARKATSGHHNGEVYIFRSASLAEPTDSRIEMQVNTADYTLTGEATDDYFGRAMASAGDIDGDGLDDVIFGAYGNDEAGSNAGMTYIMLGSDMTESGSISLSEASYRIAGAYGSEQSGYSVSGGGDIDGDGRSDVLIGAYSNPDGGMYAGAVYVLFGSSFGDEQELDLYLDADYQLIGENDYDRVGQSVANAGDVDGDGLDDIVIGTQYLKNPSGEQVGGIYVFLAQDLGDVVPINLAMADQKILGEESGDHAGFAVSGGGDVNGDGTDDILVGAYNAESGGMTYLLFGE